MAKLRFPGKALKLNQRKTAKFVRTNEPSPEELRLIQIKKGLRLFRSVFGDSEEDDFEGFLPITNYEESNISSQQFKNTSNKKENKYITDRALKYKNCSSGPLNVKKLNGTKKLQKNNKRQHINEEQGKQDGIRKDTFLANNGRSSQIIIDNNCSSDENAVCSRKSCDNKISKVVNHNNTNKNEQSSEDDVPTSISLYTDHITEEPEIQPTRQSQRISDRHSNDHQIREKKIKEKIEKMLRSPWDSRLKQTPPKAPDDLAPLDNQQCIGTVGTDILRKPRLNLSKKTLQKIRSTSSINEFLPVPNDIPDGKCGFCQMIYSPGSLVKYGVSCCEQCNASITDIVESWDSSKICFGANGDCQLFGLSYEERCRACWIGRVLQSCIMPSLLHDRLRKQLPDVLKEKIPTSLGRNYNKSGTHELESILHPLHGNTFGSTVSLAGGWRRKIRGNSVVVISPSGKKFKSIRKLEKFLSKEGISADATMFFGNTASNERNMFHSFSNGQSVNKHKPSKKKGTSNVEVTNLPGGWERRIKWSSHNKFDTHIYSPDGKIFRHPNDLSDYFQKIGKMDDVQKYFPINNIAHYNNSGLSSCDTYSSTDLTSEDNSLYNSESNPNDEVNYNSEQMLVSDQYVPEDTQLLKQIVISNFDTDASGTEKTFEQDSYIESDATDTSAINIQSILSAEENDPDLDTDFHKQDDRKNSENTGSVFPNERIIVSESLKKYMPCPKSKKMLNLRMDKQSASETNTDNSSKFYSSLDNLFSNSAKMDDKSFEQEQTPKPSDSHEDKDEKIPKIHHKKLSTFTTERFGENWSRKIKWDDNGSGKISYITSPEGQKIHSRIELMAYFKKAGNPSATIDHYFPKTIIRSEIKEKPSKKLSKVKSSKTKNVVFGSQQANDTNQPKKIRKSLNKLSDTAASENGPRVKNVCRGAAQALKLPRAVFPEECPSNKTYKRMRTCKKCTGCLTPNCLKCSNCLSMKKYGGNGIKKHRCVLRTCLNPKRVQMHSELSTESDTSFLATDRTDSDVDESHCGKVQFPHLENEQSQSNSVMCNNVKTFEDTASLKSFTKKSSKNNDKTKKINHSASINIDYWHDYCTEDTAMTGFPIITTELPEVEAFCFRCGSAGQEKLIFCSLCCEGIHPFCLEEGELPESQIDCAEDVWVCRRCVVCHVCGTTGCEQLMQCSVCIKYFHLDCIGPLHHVGCLDKMTTWERQLFATIGGSWARQWPIYEAADHLRENEEVELLEELESPQNSFVFNYVSVMPSENVCSPRKKQDAEKLVQSVCIEEESRNLEEEDDFTICLEDEYEIASGEIGTESFLNLTINSELQELTEYDKTGMYSAYEMHSQVQIPCIKFPIIDNEYHKLKYRKILSHGNSRTPLPLHIWLKLIHTELFDVLDFPSWTELVSDGLLPSKSRYLLHAKEEAENKTAYDVSMMKKIIKQHQTEMKDYLKYLVDLEKRQIETENLAFKLFRNLLRDRERRKNDQMTGINETEEDKGTPMSSEDEANLESYSPEEEFIIYHAVCEEWQPKDWEDFDIMMAIFMADYPEADAELGDIIDSYLYSDILDPTPVPSLVLKRKIKTGINSTAKRSKFDSMMLSPRTLDRTIKRAKSSICSVNLTQMNLNVLPIGNGHASSFKKKLSPCEPLNIDPPEFTSPLRETLAMEEDTHSKHDSMYQDHIDISNTNVIPLNGDKISLTNTEKLSLADTEKILPVNTQKIPFANTLQAPPANTQRIPCISSDKSLHANTDKIPLVNSGKIHHDNSDIIPLFNSGKIHHDNTDKIPPAKTPQIPPVNTINRVRRRTIGRASELASLRKSMMDM